MRLLGILITLLLTVPQQPTPGRIGGIVLDDATGAPLSNVQVTLQVSRSAPTRQVVTDEKGSYVLDNVPPGRYQLQASLAGFLSQGYRQTAPQAFPDIIIEPGRIYDVPFRLTRAATLAGRVYGADGVPARNAQIQLLILQLVNGQSVLMRPFAVPTVQTDEQGNYNFTGIQPGGYFVRGAFPVEPAGRSGLVVTPDDSLTYYPGVSSPDEAVAVTVNAGGDRRAVDFTLVRVPTFNISGRIINPLAGAERPSYNYYLVRRDARLQELEQPRPNRTADVGQFEIGSVQPGSYELYIAFQTGFPSASQRNRAPEFYTGRVSVNVVDRDITNLTVAIEPGIDLPGRVVLDEAATAAAPEIPNLYPLLVPVGGLPGILSPTATLGRSLFVQPDGTFVLPHSTRGQYRLVMVLQSPPAANFYLASARLGTEDILGRPFEITSNTTGPLVLDVSGAGGRVQGQVTASDGQPMAEVQVMLVPPINFREDQTAYKSATTNEQGRFTISGIRPGGYTAFAVSQRADLMSWMNFAFLTPYLASGTIIDVSKGQNIQKDLRVIVLRP